MGDFSLGTIRVGSLVKAESPTRAPVVTQAPRRAEDDAGQGTVKIRGSDAQMISLTKRFDYTVSRQVVKETKRKIDVVRIKNPENPEQYVDVNRPKEITTAPEVANLPNGGTATKTHYTKQKEAPHIETLEMNVEEKNPDYQARPGTEDI